MIDINKDKHAEFSALVHFHCNEATESVKHVSLLSVWSQSCSVYDSFLQKTVHLLHQKPSPTFTLPIVIKRRLGGKEQNQFVFFHDYTWSTASEYSALSLENSELCYLVPQTETLQKREYLKTNLASSHLGYTCYLAKLHITESMVLSGFFILREKLGFLYVIKQKLFGFLGLHKIS